MKFIAKGSFRNPATWVRQFFVITALATSSFIWAQNGIIGSGFGTNDWSTTDNFSTGAGSSRIYTTTANATGSQYFRLVTNWSSNYNQWGPSSTVSDYQVSPGTAVSSSEVVENSTTKAYYISVPSTSYNYVFKTKEGGNPPSNVGMIVFEVQSTVSTCTGVSQDYTTVSKSLSPTITATLDNSLPTGQGIYIRYTTDNFSTSTIAAMSGSGTSYSYSIPTQTVGTTVTYYILTSGSSQTISHSDADFYTINLNNNSGSNYSYTVTTDQFQSSASGDWSDNTKWQVGNGTNWVSASSYPTSSDGTITIASGHTITLDMNATASALIINSGGTFTGSDATARTLTFENSTSGTTTVLTNNGTWSNGTGGSTVIFSGAPSSGDAIHEISGTIAFENLTVNKSSGTSNVGASFLTGCSLTGTLEIGSGGYIATAPPTGFYSTSAILKFNQGGGATYDVNSGDYSWSFSQVPQNLTISSGTVNLNADRIASGDLVIDGGTLVLNNNTPKLTIQGDWTRSSGTFTPGTGTVTLSGSSNSTITTASTAVIGNFQIDKSGGAKVILANDAQITINLDLKAGTIDLGSNTLEINGSISETSGTIDADAGTVSFTYASEITLSSTTFTGDINNLTINGGGIALGTSTTINGTLTLTSGSLRIGGNTLTLNGTISGTSTLLANGSSSNLSLGGSGALGTIYMDQSSAGTSNRLNNFTFNRSSGTFDLGNEMQIIGIVTHTDGTLETNGNLKLVASASTTYGQIAGSGSGSITEAVSMQMIIPGSSSGWRNFCVPFDTITTGQLGNQLILATSNGTSINSKTYDQNLFTWTESSASWTAVSSASSSLYGNGYNMYVFDPSSNTVTLAGTYSSSTKNYGSLVNSNSGNASNDGWHLLANPFPSGIDWNAVTKPGNLSGSYSIFSVNDGNYRSWNGSTGSAGQYIPPMHAFWVKASATLSSDLQISSANRSTSTANHLQKGNTLNNFLKIEVKGSSTYRDALYLYTDQQNRVQSPKLMGLSEAPNLWVNFDNEPLSILPMEESDLTKALPLGFTCSSSGTYHLSFLTENMGGNDPWLEDRKTNTWHRIADGDFSFQYDASEAREGRFFIHYQGKASSIEPAQNQKPYWIGQDDQGIILSVNQEMDIRIIDVSGRVVFTKQVPSGIHHLDFTPSIHGVYVIELQSGTQRMAEKLIR